MLFGTSGIRGLYGKEIDEKLAMKIANLFVDEDVVIARDTRTTSESLSFAAVSGVLSKGHNVIYLGIAPTPTLVLATQKHKCKGIMVTASHNPPEYNGLKLFEDGREISRKTETEIEARYKKECTLFVQWDKVGALINEKLAVENHKNLIKKLVNTAAIKKRKPKIVVDANGAGAVLTADLLSELGCEVVSINNSLSDFCSSRNSEPNAENLKGLAAKVCEVKADLGIGHDGDGDRTVVADETGEILALDVQLAIMVEHEIEKSKIKNPKVVSTVEASLCIKETVERFGAKLLITQVGSLYVSETIEKEKALFGGEPCGEYIFAAGLHVPDGILTAAKFVEILCEKGKLSELRKGYKIYPMLREKFKCEDSKKYEIVKKIKSKIKSAAKVRTDDGIRVDEEDGWFLIRASGTEPIIRLTVEYKDKKKLEERASELKRMISDYLR